MKKLNNKGFILAETLVVSVFLMVIFGMIYSNFYPIIGEYEKREYYDDVDGKYAAYWIKRMIDNYYVLQFNDYLMLNELGYTRLNCMTPNMPSEKLGMCKELVNALEVSRCDSEGLGCDIYITRYVLDYEDDSKQYSFKDTVRNKTNYTRKEELQEPIKSLEKRYKAYNRDLDRETVYNIENYYIMEDMQKEFNRCCKDRYEFITGENASDDEKIKCYFELGVDEIKTHIEGSEAEANEKIKDYCDKRKAFLSPATDYILSLPDYKTSDPEKKKKLRVIVVMYHTKHLNLYDELEDEGYYSFATMELDILGKEVFASD